VFCQSSQFGVFVHKTEHMAFRAYLKAFFPRTFFDHVVLGRIHNFEGAVAQKNGSKLVFYQSSRFCAFVHQTERWAFQAYLKALFPKTFFEHVLLGTVHNFEVVVAQKNGSKLEIYQRLRFCAFVHKKDHWAFRAYLKAFLPKPFFEHALLDTIHNFEVVVAKKKGSKLVFL